jgi:pyrroline-5-carboxylate reductase
MQLTLIGAGNMGGALLHAWANDPSLGLDGITVIDPHVSQLDLPPNPACRINHHKSPDGAGVAGADCLILAVKPQVLPDILPEYAAIVGDGTQIISIAAGIPIDRLQSAFGVNQPIMRAMPNTPAQVGGGMTAIFANEQVKPDHLEQARNLFQSVGKVIELLHEDQFHAVTALSGSGPGYLFKIVESLVHAGQQAGLPSEVAARLARQTMIGAGQLLEKSGKSASDLRRAVTSPNGTTEAGLNILSDPLNALMVEVIRAAESQSRQLAGEESPDPDSVTDSE